MVTKIVLTASLVLTVLIMALSGYIGVVAYQSHTEIEQECGCDVDLATTSEETI